MLTFALYEEKYSTWHRRFPAAQACAGRQNFTVVFGLFGFGAGMPMMFFGLLENNYHI